MIRKILNRVRVNFRQSSSDRKGTSSYRDYHKKVVHLFKRVPRQVKIFNKQYDNNKQRIVPTIKDTK